MVKQLIRVGLFTAVVALTGSYLGVTVTGGLLGSLAAAVALALVHFLAMQLILRALFGFLMRGAHPNFLLTIIFGALGLVLAGMGCLTFLSAAIPGFVQTTGLTAQFVFASVLVIASAPTYLRVSERKTIDVGYGKKKSPSEFRKYLGGR